jgi:threonine aldolase
MVCLSKGLCAPVGSVVAGSKEFIEMFRKNRKLLGGGMRQAGVIAGPGLIAIRKMRHSVGKDNEMAKLFASKLEKFPWATVLNKVEISILFFKINIKEVDLAGLGAFLKEHKIAMSLPKTTDSPIRVITHHYVR